VQCERHCEGRKEVYQGRKNKGRKEGRISRQGVRKEGGLSRQEGRKGIYQGRKYEWGKAGRYELEKRRKKDDG
jgi:hypothetical protein